MAQGEDEYDVVPEAPPPIPKRRTAPAPPVQAGMPLQPGMPHQAAQPAYGYQRGPAGFPPPPPPRQPAGPTKAKWWMIGLGVVFLGVVFFLVNAVVSSVRRARAPAKPGTLRVDHAAFFPPPPMRPLEGEEGVQFTRISLAGKGPGQAMQMWLYMPADKHTPKSLPCVFIAPAGSNLITGMSLSEGDQPEHVPYARAGFAVLAYEIDGEPVYGGDSEVKKGAQKFISAEGGLANAKTAIEYVLAKVPEVDPERLYCAGHSSAGTLALQLACSDGRMKGCVAYAPASDVIEQFIPDAVRQWDEAVPGLSNFLHTYSPNRMGPPKCPVYVFHATEDENVSVEQSRAYKKLHPSKVKLITLKGGDHYHSMVFRGIPAAIKWLNELPSEKAAAKPAGEGADAATDGEVAPDGESAPEPAAAPDGGAPPAE